MILFKDWQIQAQGLIARQYDNLSRRLEVLGDLPDGWEWAVLVFAAGHEDIIPLAPMDGGVGVTLNRDQLSIDGYYSLQLRGTQGDVVKHTNVVQTFIPKSLTGTGQWPTVPSEFLQVEQRILELNAHPPVPGENGYWLIWNPDTDQYEASAFPLPGGGGGSSVEIDATLTVEGAAADAKAVGEKVSQLSEDKMDKSGWSADKYLGTDSKGKVVEKDAPSGGSSEIDKKTMTAYDAGAVRPFLRYDTFWDVVNPMFVTQHMNERATNNSVEIINDGATVHEVYGVLSPNGKYVYITYLKNIDGTTADVGSTSESGTTKVYFTAAYNAYGVTRFTPAMSETVVELFAKGTELSDGTTINTGGPSCPMLYSDGATLFAVCLFAGNGCGGYVRTADISGNPAPEDVVWSAAQPWTLSIDGESGNFDINRLNGWTDATWQTNNQIVWESAISMFVMAVCVNDKAVVLVKSADGIDWE